MSPTTSPVSDPDAPRVLEQLVRQAEAARASDIHLQMLGKTAQVAFRLDGLMTPARELPEPIAERVFGRIKFLARLKTYQESLPQDGRIDQADLGAQSNDLPGVLTLLADHYQRAGLIWTRLKGLMVYPAIVLLASVGVSVLIAFLIHTFIATGVPELISASGGLDRGARWTPAHLFAVTAVPCLLLVVLLAAALIAVSVPAARRQLRWTLPAFKETSLSNLGSTLSLVLAKGGTLGDALDLAARLEQGTPAEAELGLWKTRLTGGQAKFADLAAGSRAFPPLFVWLVAQGGEDLATGLRRAAEVYFARAVYRTDLLLYLALPVSVLTLGLMIIFQFAPVLRQMIFLLDMLGNVGG